MSRSLILAKHSLVSAEPGFPRESWSLSDEGRRRCALLAQELAAYQPSLIISSDEWKAQETAHAVAAQLQLKVVSYPGLQENDRRGLPFVPTTMFRKRIAMFFRERQERVMGMESACEAQQRFAASIAQVVADHPEGNLAVITHATVLSLFTEAHNAEIDAFQLWASLDQPSLVVLTLPDYRLQTTIPHIS